MNNADKRKQAVQCLKLAMDDYLQGGPVFIGHESIDADYLAGGLGIAFILINEIQGIMKHLLIVPNWQSTKTESCRYMPVKGTTKDDCYEALWQIQELLGMRTVEIGEKVMEDEVDCWKLDVGRTEGERR